MFELKEMSNALIVVTIISVAIATFLAILMVTRDKKRQRASQRNLRGPRVEHSAIPEDAVVLSVVSAKRLYEEPIHFVSTDRGRFKTNQKLKNLRYRR